MIRGRLQRWNDEKGFGFIRPLNADGDVFVHISAFRGLPRRPVVGDVVNYTLETDREGRSKAINATIEGLIPERRPSASRSARQSRRRGGSPSKLAVAAILFAVVAASGYAYQVFPGIFQLLKAKLSGVTTSSPALPARPASSPTYRCEGKIYCSEMRSCEEATFYLRNCPDTKMDGDGDGVPCERQWCSW
ncbi:cold shock domain-containing protein [Thiorhodococcus mannitoliphagus]|uniref:Cold shock domain-containing protein n=1 Tax=Thiorhodococcus mannitoliphagus TaxID=329406 RepID=A0A6P1DWH7_9GAMM|nr:cold shock domain-containing protein [Thiorhodococcus mannitoliphagus]